MRSQPRRLWLVVLMIAFIAISAMSMIGPALALPEKEKSKSGLPAACNNHPITFNQFRPFSKKVWDRNLWERKKPGPKILDAKAHKIHCAAGPGHVEAMQHQWTAGAKSFYKYRDKMLWRVHVTPFPGGGHWWAIPYYVVICESGGRYNDPSAPNGAYSLLAGSLQGVPTWETWRPNWASEYALPYQAPPKAQDLAAHKLYRTYGLEPWECA